MIEITVACPNCSTGKLTITYDKGSPDVRSLPNGDPGYPGDPAAIEALESTCQCWPAALVESVFDGVAFETWLCETHLNPGAGRGPMMDECRTWNRVGELCHNCQSPMDADARRGVGTDPHPLMEAAEMIVSGWLSIAGWFEIRSMDQSMQDDPDDGKLERMQDAAMRSVIGITAEQLARERVDADEQAADALAERLDIGALRREALKLDGVAANDIEASYIAEGNDPANIEAEPSRFPMMALLSDQGTAMAETGLCSPCCAVEENRVMARACAWEEPKSFEFQDCGENEAVHCIVCGFNADNEWTRDNS